jgi:hypothetical protein
VRTTARRGLLDQARLPDARRTAEEDDCAGARAGVGHGLPDRGQFTLSADEGAPVLRCCHRHSVAPPRLAAVPDLRALVDCVPRVRASTDVQGRGPPEGRDLEDGPSEGPAATPEEHSMHATIHQFRRSVAEESPEWAAALATDLHGGAAAGICTLAEFSGMTGAVVAFWPTAGAAASAVDRRTGRSTIWLDAAMYEVVQTHVGVGAEREARFAQRTCLDGPRSQAQAGAGERAMRERVWPAVRDVAGIVAVHELRDGHNGEVILMFSTALETYEEVERAIFATELLPGEDPALLAEPDRLHLDRVLFADLPALTTAGERS